MLKRALGESNSAAPSSTAAPSSKRTRSESAAELPRTEVCTPDPLVGCWVEVLDGFGAVQRQLAFAHAGRIFGQGGVVLEPCRLEGAERSVYREASTSFAEVFGR